MHTDYLGSIHGHIIHTAVKADFEKKIFSILFLGNNYMIYIIALKGDIGKKKYCILLL